MVVTGVPSINPGLIRMQEVTAAHPWLLPTAPLILVGGTNGKGTTAGFIFTLLAKFAGLKTGLYTSPHVSCFSERIQVSSASLTASCLASKWQTLELLIGKKWQLSFFECATLLAFHVFNTMQTEINIIEVGLGGTWDATNICDPLAAVIVSIGRDHQQYLGNTWAEIMADKMGICREHKPFFWGNQGSGATDPKTQAVIAETVARRHLQLFAAGRDFDLRGNKRLEVRLVDLPRVAQELPRWLQQKPHYLQRNFCLAYAVSYWLARRLRPTSSFTVPTCATLLPATIKGRFQFFYLRHRQTGRRLTLLMDACHNCDGAQVFVTEVEKRFGTLPGLVALLVDKEVDKILPLLATCLNPMAIFAVDNKRSLSRDHLPPMWQRHWFPDFVEAWQTIIAGAKLIVVCGSFYGLGAALSFLTTQYEIQT